MITKILLGLAAFVVVLIIVAAVQPSTFRVSRSASMAAPADIVFAQVNDLHKWESWSPWAKLDPGMKQAYSGAPEGKGAAMSWSGNHEVGEGSMTITESRPSDLILMDLHFLKPFTARNTTEFVFTPTGDQTTVTWTMTGSKNLMCKAIGLVVNMDKMCGGQFEQGLAQMKAIVEASPAANATRLTQTN